MSQIKVNSIIPIAGVPTGGGGGIIQVKQVVKTDTFSTTGTTSFVDVTGLTVSITPTSTSSKILVLYDLSWSSSDGHISCRLMRGSTMIKVGDADGNRIRATGHRHEGGSNSGDTYDIDVCAGTFLDSPATTSSVTYKIMVRTNSTGNNVQVNRGGNDANADYEGRTASSITLMEVSA